MRQLATYGIILSAMLVLLTACFSRPTFDTGRMRLDPETGAEIVENFKSPPKPGDDNFVGPVDPATDQSFTEGKRAAKADFNKTVGWASGVAIWGLLALAAVTFLVSLFVKWIPTGASLKCALAAAGVVGLRYALISFGTIAVDLAVYITAATAIIVGLVVGLPMVIAWVKRKTWKRATALAEEGEHIEGAVALAATVDPAVDKIRKQVDGWLETYHKRGVGAESSEEAQDMWNEARIQLVKLGLIKPEGK